LHRTLGCGQDLAGLGRRLVKVALLRLEIDDVWKLGERQAGIARIGRHRHLQQHAVAAIIGLGHVVDRALQFSLLLRPVDQPVLLDIGMLNAGNRAGDLQEGDLPVT
jgi:hypothetical protein